jgi:hypothetical protein
MKPLTKTIRLILAITAIVPVASCIAQDTSEDPQTPTFEFEEISESADAITAADYFVCPNRVEGHPNEAGSCPHIPEDLRTCEKFCKDEGRCKVKSEFGPVCTNGGTVKNPTHAYYRKCYCGPCKAAKMIYQSGPKSGSCAAPQAQPDIANAKAANETACLAYCNPQCTPDTIHECGTSADGNYHQVRTLCQCRTPQ